MRKLTIVMLLLLISLFVCQSAFAAIFTFQPHPVDFNDLYHAAYYTWGINWQPVGNILSADITFYNVNDWVEEDTDFLYVHLLDSMTPGVTTNYDWQYGGDNFVGQGILLGVYSDLNPPYGNVSPGETFSFNIPEGNFSWLADGNFGFGIDPDCVFYNDGVKVTIRTDAPVPEPASMMLLGMGVLGLAALRRKT